MELAEASIESWAGRMLLVAWLGRAVELPVYAGQHDHAVKRLLPSDVPQTDCSYLMCSQTMLLFLVVRHECWLEV